MHHTCTCSQFCMVNASIWSTMSISMDDRKSAFLQHLSSPGHRSKGIENSLLFFDGHSQTKRTRKYYVRGIEIREKLNAFSCDFHSKSEAIVHVPFEHLDMVSRICSRLRCGEFIRSPGWQSVLCLESSMILYLKQGRWSMACKRRNPALRKGSERKKNEDGRTGKALVLNVFGGWGACLRRMRDAFIILQHAPPLSIVY
jgi:hypothetical protein